MNRILFVIVLVIASINILAQDNNFNKSFAANNVKKISFKEGEFIKYRIHYGIFNAGYATLELKKSVINGQQLFHAEGKGWTVGVSSFFYNIEDYYDSHFTKDSGKPIKFIRRVDEGGFIIKRDLLFDHKKKLVAIRDLKEMKDTLVSIGDVQDLVSSFYHLRNYDLKEIKKGDEIQINLFFDNENFPFRLKFLKKEIISTKFGDIKTWKIMPLVQKGRVFHGQKSLTVWISDDDNKLPVRVQASLAVGSLKADLKEYNGLAHPLAIVK